MLRKRYAALMMAAALPALSACVQATRHSNTMVFGTSTTIGLKAGQNVNQVPEVMIAYDRQEAVIMPLLANTGEKDSDSGNLLTPCDVEADDDPDHPCKFVGIRRAGDNVTIQDSYSVLASFGARIEGNAAQTKGSVGLAQYFATGVAAQLLAANGGASVVAVGAAAEKSAEAAATGAATAALLDQEAFGAGVGDAPVAIELEEQVYTKIANTAAANLIARLDAFDQALGIPSGASQQCADLTPANCATRLKSREIYADFRFDRRQADVKAALAAWETP